MKYFLQKHLLLNGWDDLCRVYAIEANCYFSLKKYVHVFQGKNGIQTYNTNDTGALLDQVSYEVLIHWEQVKCEF